MKILARFSKKNLGTMASRYWLHRVFFGSKYSPHLALLLIAICSTIVRQTSASDSESQLNQQESPSQQDQASINTDDVLAATKQTNNGFPSNHRSEMESIAADVLAEQTAKTKVTGKAGRQGRQYDGQVSAPSTGSFASSDGAYIPQIPISIGSNYNSAASTSSPSSYASDLAGGYHQNAYYDLMARGYSPGSSLLPSMHPHSTQASYPTSPSFGGSLSSMLSSMSGGSSMFPLINKGGFDVSEIVCTAIAVAIGAVIIGAPFILIYLFVMNQTNGGSGLGGMGANANSINLTGPTSSTTVGGRKKRHTSFPEALIRQLSPLVNSEQVANTFKLLMKSISKYQ